LKTTDFIAKHEWLPNSLDPIALDYYVGLGSAAFHKLNQKPKTIPELTSNLSKAHETRESL